MGINCEKCGAPAEVHVNNVVAGHPEAGSEQHFCHKCAEHLPEETSSSTLESIPNLTADQRASESAHGFNWEATMIFALANKYASRFPRPIGLPELMWALLEDKRCTACQLLKELKIDLPSLQAAIEKLPEESCLDVTRSMIVVARDLAIISGATLAGSDHLLLAIVQEAHGAIVEVLSEYGITADQIKRAVTEDL